jgi:8-oxo-dGTP diphosphatase
MSDPKPHCYRYPHPAVTTDVVLFTIHRQALKLLLIRRGHEPHAGRWALPGGFLDLDEELKACAERELFEETGVRAAEIGLVLHQLGAFGAPGRDPRERVVSIAHLGLAPAERLPLRAGDDAVDAGWFALAELPPLAFDHADIIAAARQRLLGMLDDVGIAGPFLPTVFRLDELRALYECFVGAALDESAFAAWATTPGRLEPIGSSRRPGSGGPARLYRMPSQPPPLPGAGFAALLTARAPQPPAATARFPAPTTPNRPTGTGP